jgi:SAM-dependent methyltransferase
MRRFDLSDDELARVRRVYERPLAARRLARLLIKHPALAVEVLRAMEHGALDSVATGSSVMWAIDAERVREAVPDAAAGASWSGGESFLESLMGHVTRGARVVDFGAGAGRFARHVAPLAERLYCVDSSRLLLGEAREVLGEHDNVTFVQNRGWTVPGVADGTIDLFFSQGVIGHVGPREVVSVALEARRVLRPGGMLLFSAYTFNPSSPSEAVREQFKHGRIHAGRPQPYTRDYLASLLALAQYDVAAGLEVTADESTGYSVFAARRP